MVWFYRPSVWVPEKSESSLSSGSSSSTHADYALYIRTHRSSYLDHMSRCLEMERAFLYIQSIDPNPNYYSLDIFIRGYPPKDPGVIPVQTPNITSIVRKISRRPGTNARRCKISRLTRPACRAFLSEPPARAESVTIPSLKGRHYQIVHCNHWEFFRQ